MYEFDEDFRPDINREFFKPSDHDGSIVVWWSTGEVTDHETSFATFEGVPMVKAIVCMREAGAPSDRTVVYIDQVIIQQVLGSAMGRPGFGIGRLCKSGKAWVFRKLDDDDNQVMKRWFAENTDDEGMLLRSTSLRPNRGAEQYDDEVRSLSQVREANARRNAELEAQVDGSPLEGERLAGRPRLMEPVTEAGIKHRDQINVSFHEACKARGIHPVAHEPYDDCEACVVLRDVTTHHFSKKRDRPRGATSHDSPEDIAKPLNPDRPKPVRRETAQRGFKPVQESLLHVPSNYDENNPFAAFGLENVPSTVKAGDVVNDF